MLSQNYVRRRAMWSNSRGRYVQTSLGSRESMESDDEGDASSISGLSTQSTKSLKSYKRWRKALRQKRRNLKREEPIDDKSVEALDLSGNFRTTSKKVKEPTFTFEKEENPAPVIDISAEGTDIDNPLPTILTTIKQSPVQPYYSSSPLTTSSDDSDVPSTPERSPCRSGSEIEEVEDQKNLSLFKDSSAYSKNSLQRRSYPFLTLPTYEAEDTERRSPNYLAPPKTVFSIIERRRASSAGEIGELNRTSPPKPPSLLELAQYKTKTSSMDEESYDQSGPTNPEVFYTETNGFTITLPAYSPTVPAHMLENEIPAQNVEDDVIMTEESRERIQKIMEINNKKKDDWRKKNSIEDLLVRNPDNDEMDGGFCQQKALKTDPGMYFLPPLIAKAIENSASNDETIKRDKNSNLAKAHRAASSGSSTQEESGDENVYMENTDDIFQDLQEREFLCPPSRHKAMPETDTSSIGTRESVDPIEEILTREDDVPADDKTFTLNGKAIITPRTTEESKSAHTEVVAVASDQAALPADNDQAYRVIEEKIETKKEDQETELKPVHSHKVGKSKNCAVCKAKEKGSVGPGIDVVEDKVDATVKGEESQPKIKSKPIHSHKVGDDAKCEVCAANKADSSDIVSDLCCTIL